MAPYHPHPGQATDKFCNFFDKNYELGTTSVFPGKGKIETAAYLPDDVQDDYFTLECVKLILILLYSHRGGPVWLPAEPSAVRNNCKRILAILLYIGRGDRIEYFVHKPELYDKKLPFLDRPQSFPDHTGDSYFDEFQEAQWKFCAPEIDNSRRVDWDRRTILPFVRIGELGKGHSGKAYKIRVHPAHDKLRRGPASDNTHTSQNPHEYVLKTFHPRSGSEAVWGHEVEAHIALREAHRPDKGIVWFHNCYTHGETCNVILELAPRGDLERLLASLPRPTTHEDIMLFWRRFLCLLETLAFLRNMRYDDKSAYQLCHFDIKPRNILVFPGATDSPYDLHFKIGDFGSSNFQVMRNDDHAYTEYYPGTRTFGAPECYNWNPFSDEMRTPQNVLPDADMWSLGAIAAEIATWMQSGSSGIGQFHGWRVTTLSYNPNFQDADCFHNGKDVLDCVNQQLEFLKKDACPTTAEVIRLIHKHMLVAKPENRMDARELRIEADNALNAIQQRMEAPVVLPEINRPDIPLGRRRTVPLGNHFPHNHGNGWPISNQPTQSTPNGLVNPPGNAWHNIGPYPDNARELGSNNPYRRRPLPTTVIHQDSKSDPNSFISNESHRQHPHLNHASDSGGNLSGNLHKDGQTYSAPAVPISNGTHSAKRSLPYSKNPWISSPNNPEDIGLGINQSQSNHHTDQPPTGGTTWLESEKFPVSDPKRSSESTFKTAENISGDAKFGNGTISIHIPDLAKPESESEMQNKHGLQVPFLSYDEAIERIQSVQAPKGRLRRHSRGHRPEAIMLKEFGSRDFIILVDDSTSMRTHWTQVADCAKLIADFTTPYDDNGVEVRFMSNYKSKTTTNDVQRICSLVEEHKPQNNGRVFSLVNDVLDLVLGEYRKKLENENPLERSKLGKMLKMQVKTLAVFVLTDGEFGYCDAKGPIKDLVSTLRDQKRPSNQAGVQFVRFGNNPEAKARLDDLDDFLNPNVHPELANDPDNRDIVDTEPWEGVNVWKLLLGSINRLFDRSDLPSYQLTPVASPIAESALLSPVPLDGQMASVINTDTLGEASGPPHHWPTYPPSGPGYHR